MQIEINNFRGIKQAVFDLQKIALIGAQNANGKSSIAQAVGALLTGNAVPVRGVTKATAGQLVHAGTAAGSACMIDGENRTDIAWPKATCTTEGAPPTATEFAAGLSSVLLLDKKDRAKALAVYLNAEPTRQDLDAGLDGLGLLVEQLDKIWEMIEAGGWDGAHDQVKAKGAKLKGQWEQVTSKRYGTKIAEEYVPEGWEPNLEGESKDGLEAVVADARECLEAAIAADAVDEDRRGELSALAATVPELLTAKNEGVALKAETAKAYKEAGEAVLKLPPIDTGITEKCPHCSKPVEMVGGKIVKAVKLTKPELAKRDKAHDDATEAMADAKKEDDKVAAALTTADNDLRAAQLAAKELDAMPAATTADGTNIDAARGTLQDAEDRLRAWTQKTTADNRATSIGIIIQTVDALKPAGIRQKKLAKAMSTANAELKTTTNMTTEWGVVTLDGDLEASLNGTPYGLLSKSERYRCRITLQAWMATKDNSNAVVIDGADVLVDKALRNDLFKMLQWLPMPAVVTMAVSDSALMPDLAAADVGQSYWIESAELKPL